MTSQPNIPANPLENAPSYPTWVTDELLRDYYDTEWGMPVTDERGLFEALSLELFRWDSLGERFLPAARHFVTLLKASIPNAWLRSPTRMLRDSSRTKTLSVTRGRFARSSPMHG